MRPPAGTWLQHAPWVVASLPFVLLVAWFWNRGPGLDADDWAQTLMHAEALAEGRPYGDIGYIGSRLDIAPARQPPGLPAVLAGAMALTGGFHWWTVKLAMVLAAFPFFLLAGLTFAREHGREIGVAVTVFSTVALAARPPSAATHVQTDLGFAALIWGVLFLLDRPGRITWPVTCAVFLLASLAMAYRYLGAALIPTVALVALLHPARGSRKLFAPLAVWLVGGLAVIGVVGTSIVTSQVSLDPTRLWRGVIPMIRAYSGSAVEAYLYPFPGDLPNDVFHAITVPIAVLGLVAWTRSHWRSAAWLFTVVYLLTLLMAFNRSGRYLIPLYPILIFGLLHGVRLVAGRIRSGWAAARGSRIAAVSGLTVAGAALLVVLIGEPRSGGYLHELPDTRGLFTYLSQQQPARVAFGQPRVLSWATDIPAMVLVNAPPDETVPELARLEITHVVLDNLDLQARRTLAMRRTMAAHACRFEPVFANGSFEVYRFLHECTDAT